MVAATEPYAYHPGAIIRIRVHNFLTYDDAVIEPGPRLNIIVGPNGSGKSSVMCAINLGLGDDAKNLQRGDGIRAFVMRDKEKGWVEVELKGKKEGDPNIVIRRDMERGSNKSSFKVNGQKATQDNVKTMMKEMGIQLTNLCTFLPQEKVGQFTEMNPQQLLLETEKALSTGQVDLYQTHVDLCKEQEAMGKVDSGKDAVEKDVKRLKEQLEKMEPDKNRMVERRNLLKEISLLEKACRWLTWISNQAVLKEERDAKTAKEKEAREAEALVLPFKQRMEAYAKQSTDAQSLANRTQAAFTQAKKDVGGWAQKVEACEDAVAERSQDVKELDAQRERREKLREQLQQRLARAISVRDQTDQSALMEEMDGLKQQGRKAKAELTKKEQEVSSLKQQQGEVGREIDGAEKQIKTMQDQANQRMRRLQNSRLQNAGDACWVNRWVKENTGSFTGRVYGPLALEVSVEDQRVAAMVEQQCPQWLLVSFVVENQHDKELLLRECKDKAKKKCNVIILQDRWEQDLKKEFYTTQDLKEMEKEGITGVLSSFIDAPPQVLSCLRTWANVHRVLIGDQRAEEKVGQDLIKRLCARGASGPAAAGGGGGGGGGGDEDEKGGKGSAVVYTQRSDGVILQHRGMTSFYSKETTTQTKITNRPQVLGSGGGDDDEERDQAAREAELKQRIEKGKEELQKLKVAVRDTDEEKNVLGQQLNKMLKDYKKVKDKLDEARKSHAQVKTLSTQLTEIEAELAKDVGKQRDDMERDVRSAVSEHVTTVVRASDSVANLLSKWEARVAPKMTSTLSAHLKRAAEREMQQRSAENVQLQAEVNQMNKDHEAKLTKFKAEYAELNTNWPIGGDDPHVDVKDLVDEHRAEPEVAYEQLESKRGVVDAIHDDPEVLRKYKACQKEYDEAQAKLNGLNEKSTKGQDILRKKAERWAGQLQSLTQKLDRLFSEYMNQMECAGQVVLEQDPNDYSSWGLVLMVKFRETSKLQALQARTQSGGERSVSTILFLMALQDMLPSPFRAVDEINQGMDERNERLVFSRIVANSTKTQYFLVTPKLLPGLTAMEMDHVTVLFVFNAPELLPFDKWDVANFIARKRGLAAGGNGYGGGGGGGAANKRGRISGGGAAGRVEELDDE